MQVVLGLKSLEDLFVEGEGLGGGRESPAFDLILLIGEGGLHSVGEVSVLFGMFGHKTGAQAKDIVDNLDLAIAAGAGADADGRDADPPGNERRQRGGHGL